MGYFLRVSGLLTVLLLATVAFTATSERYIQARIHVDKKADWVQLNSFSLDRVSQTDKYVEIVTYPEQLEKLRSVGLQVDVVYDDMTAFFQKRLDIRKDMGGYMTLAEINADIDAMITNYPAIATKHNIGTSIEGRTLWAVCISDNDQPPQDEPEILLTAAIHAREVITPLVVLNIMNHLLDNYGVDPDVTELVDNRELWFVVPVNPDGYYHNEVTDPGGGGMWRKNRRNNGDGTFGVDPNRNYAYEWGYDDNGSSPVTSDQTYRGTGPFSEPETQAMRDFTEAHEFVIVVYYHSYSNLMLWPWGYDYFLTPDEGLFQVMGDSMTIHNGYVPQPGHALYPANGTTDDWHYGEQTTKNKNLSFTFEVGSSSDNFWPPLDRIDPLVNENLQPALFLMRIANNPYALLAPIAPIVTVADSVDSAAYSITWTHVDTLNPAVMFELVEMSGFIRKVDSASDFTLWNNNGFELASGRKQSYPTSFYSGSGNSMSNTIDLIQGIEIITGDSLTFWTWYEIEQDWDYAYVEVSTDGTTFNPIAGSFTTTSNPNGNNRGNGITGFSSGWVQAKFDLAAYVGQNIKVRFSYYTDSYVAEEGIYIDDIYPVESFASQVVVANNLPGSPYDFTDHPIGEFSYKVRAKDSQDQWGDYSAFVSTIVNPAEYICVDSDGDGYGDPGHPENHCATDNCPDIFNADQNDADSDGLGDLCDACPNDPDNDLDSDGVCGDLDNCPEIANADQADTNGDDIGDACCCEGMTGNIDLDAQGSIDISDLVYLVSYMFSGGTVPGCPAQTDMNGDGTPADITDLIYLVTYMFSGGPEPVACP